MNKKCPKCGKILYKTNRLDPKGNMALDPEFKKMITQGKDGLFVKCLNCKKKFPAVLINKDNINRIIIVGK